MDSLTAAKKIEIAYRTQNLRTGAVKDHRKIVTAAKLQATLLKLDEQGAYDVFTSDVDAGAHDANVEAGR